MSLRSGTTGLRSGISTPASSGGGSWTLNSEIEYIYDGKRVIQERDIDNNPLVSYTRGNDLSGTLEGAGGIGGLLARTDGSGNTFYHADGNGNITYLETSAQGLGAKYRYDPFGNLTSSSGTYATANTYRFSSKEWVPSVNGYYYLYRFYMPGIERWLNRDPIGERGGFNLYGAMLEDLINKLDPFGYLNLVPPNRCDNTGPFDPNKMCYTYQNLFQAEYNKLITGDPGFSSLNFEFYSAMVSRYCPKGPGGGGGGDGGKSPALPTRPITPNPSPIPINVNQNWPTPYPPFVPVPVNPATGPSLPIIGIGVAGGAAVGATITGTTTITTTITTIWGSIVASAPEWAPGLLAF